MNITDNQVLNRVWKRLIPGAISLLFAAGCSTIVNQGRYSAQKAADGANIERSMDPWVWGNAAFAVFPPVAVLGFGIDAFSGNWYRYYDSGLPPPSAQPPPGRPLEQQPQRPQTTNPNSSSSLLDSILNERGK